MRIFLFMVLINGVQMLSSNFFSAIGKPVKGLVPLHDPAGPFP